MNENIKKKSHEIDINRDQNINLKSQYNIDKNLNGNNQFNNNELIILIILTAACFLLANLIK